MSNALLEIGCEEIPARFMPGFLDDLKEKAGIKLKEERLKFAGIQTLGTYRRLTLYVEGLAPKQEDLAEEVKGPPAEVAFDSNKKLTQAGLGFAKSQKVTAADLIIKKLGKKEYVFAKVRRKGEAAEKVLARLFPEIIAALYQPLSMRWGEIDFKFIRPIHWLLALYNNTVVKFELAGVKSSNITRGHRYSKRKAVSGKQKADLDYYKNSLATLGVIVDQNERKEQIRKMVAAAAKKAKGEALIEEELLSEVAFLVENPIAYLGEFNPEFLSIPQDVLITSMKKNQKYFPVVNQAGKLQAKFVVVTDGCVFSEVVTGNQKVLSARLADAKFFFDEDKKIPLKMRVGDLEGIAFFKKLGTLADKVDRMAKLADWIGRRIGRGEAEIKIIKKVCELCKADLSTKMVGEFPELQGIMGREYALLSGEEPQVAQGIFEHYLPRFAEDKLPETMPGTIVALADRLDSLVGCFAIGSIPTGSADPYGLRRAAHGVIRLVLEKKLDLLLDQVIEHGGKLYDPVFSQLEGGKPCRDYAKVKSELLNFVAGRLKPYLLEQGIRYDVVDAALADFNDILDAVSKARMLQQFIAEAWFKGIVLSADRISRIAKTAPREEVNKKDLADQEEKDLFEAYMKVNWEVSEAINKEEWAKAIRGLAKLTPDVEKFFEKVLVMHEDEKLKSNRLALLKSLEKLYLRVADFRKIVL